MTVPTDLLLPEITLIEPTFEALAEMLERYLSLHPRPFSRSLTP